MTLKYNKTNLSILKYNKVAEYKINKQKSTAFTYTNNQLEKIPLVMTTKKTKYLISLA